MTVFRNVSIFIFFIVATVLTHAAAQKVYAQIPTGEDIVITSSVPIPIPGQSITLTARSYSIDINASTVSWTVNGALQGKGIGLTLLEMKAPAAGKQATVTATAVTADGKIARGTLRIGSSEVDMIVEPGGYVPPLFPGKTNIVYQNTLNIIAFPHFTNANGSEIDPATLIYQWKRDDYVLESQSGFGKQTITLVGDSIPRAYTLSVDVRTQDGSQKGTGSVFIDYNSPQLVLYANDPLYGPMYNIAAGETLHIGSQKESGIIAVPYGFNENDKAHFDWKWSLNGVERPDLASHEQLILRTPDEGGGASTINLTVRNLKDILQGAQAGLEVIFSQPSTKTNSLTF